MLPFRRLPVYVSQRPQYQSPPSSFSSRSHYKERCAPFPKSSLTCLTWLSGFQVKKSSLEVPQGAPLWRQLLVSRRLFLHIFRNPEYKMSPDKIKSHISLKVLGKVASPPWSPAVPLWRDRPVSRAFLYISFRVPSQGALPPGSPSSHRETLRFQSPPSSVPQSPL